MKVQSVFGEWIDGEEVGSSYENIRIFVDENKNRHVVHRSDLDETYKWRETYTNSRESHFDLEEVKRKGRSGRKGISYGF